MIEPVKPVEPKGTFSRDYYYCVHCGAGRSDLSGIRSHVKTSTFCRDKAGLPPPPSDASTPNPEEGVDFAQGWQIYLMIRRWEDWAVAQERRLGRLLLLVEGADDFLMECENDRRRT